MIIEIRPKESLAPGVIDIYPGIKEKELAAFSTRFTVLPDGSIYYEGRKWTPELMRMQWQRVQDMQEAFDIALSIVEIEHAPMELAPPAPPIQL